MVDSIPPPPRSSSPTLSPSSSSLVSSTVSRPTRPRPRRCASTSSSLIVLLIACLVSTSFSSPQSLRGVVSNDTIVVQDHPVVYPTSCFNNSTIVSPKHRNLSSGRRTILIIRVIADGRAPTPTAASLRSHIFTHPFSLANQMNLCSARSLTLVPASYGNQGVVDVRINAKTSDVRAMIAESQIVAPNFIPGVSNLYNAANHVMFVFPQTNGYVAEAEIGGRYSWYNNGLAESLSVIMHEIGHNFGLDHAGIRTDEYGDYSANMGRSVSSKLSPRMCFNAANHWQLGWFPNARRTISSINAPIRISLSAFADYPSTSNTVLVKILTDSFLQFNGKTGHNDGTRANANQVVIIRQERNRLTTLLAGLSSGQTYRGNGYVVQVCSINGSRGADISIGRTTASCTGTVSSNSGSAPSPSGTSWGFSQPTAPSGNSWVATPTTPTPWFSTPVWPTTPSRPSPPTTTSWFRPTPSPPTSSWFTPSPPTTFSVGFAPTPPSSFRFAPSPSPPTFSSAFNTPWTTGWASIFGGSEENNDN